MGLVQKHRGRLRVSPAERSRRDVCVARCVGREFRRRLRKSDLFFVCIRSYPFGVYARSELLSTPGACPFPTHNSRPHSGALCSSQPPLHLLSTMSDIAVILFGPKTTELGCRSRKKHSPHPPTLARKISEPLLVMRSVAISPPTTSLPTARTGNGRLIPSIGASPSAFHHPSNKPCGASSSKTHLRAGSFEGRWLGSSPPSPNSPNPQPSSLVDSSSRSRRLMDNAIPLTMDYNDSPPPRPTSTPSSSSNSSVKHMPKKPPTTPLPPVPTLPSGSPSPLSTITSNTSKDFEATKSGSTSTLEVVDTKATTLETVAVIPSIPMVPASPDRLPSLRRKPPPPLASMSISSSPSMSPQLAVGSPPSTPAAASLSSFTQECKSVPNLASAKADCTSAGNVEKKGVNQRSPTRTPNVAPTVTALAFPLPPTQIPPTPSKAVQKARQVAHGPAESSRQRLHEPINKPIRSSTLTPAKRVPIDLLASTPLPMPSIGRSQSLSNLQKQPAAQCRTTPHRLKRPHRPRSVAPRYQSFLPSFDDMEEPHSRTIPPLPRRSA